MQSEQRELSAHVIPLPIPSQTLSLSLWLDEVRERVNAIRDLHIERNDMTPIYRELKRSGFEDLRRPMAEEWILCGNWYLKQPNKRNKLELTDFKPSREYLESLGIAYIRLDAYQGVEKAFRNMLERTIREEYQARAMEPAHYQQLKQQIEIETRNKCWKEFRERESTDNSAEVKQLGAKILEQAIVIEEQKQKIERLSKDLDYEQRKLQRLSEKVRYETTETNQIDVSTAVFEKELEL